MTQKMRLSRTANDGILEEMNKAPAPKFTILTTSHTGYEQV